MMPRLHSRIRRSGPLAVPYDQLPRDRLPARARTIALIVASAMLMEQLDSTVLTTAL